MKRAGVAAPGLAEPIGENPKGCGCAAGRGPLVSGKAMAPVGAGEEQLHSAQLAAASFL